MKNCAKGKRRKLLISIDISQHNPISLPPIMKIQVKLMDSTVIILKKKKKIHLQVKTWKICAFHAIAENSNLVRQHQLTIIFVPSVQKLLQ